MSSWVAIKSQAKVWLACLELSRAIVPGLRLEAGYFGTTFFFSYLLWVTRVPGLTYFSWQNKRRPSKDSEKLQEKKEKTNASIVKIQPRVLSYNSNTRLRWDRSSVHRRTLPTDQKIASGQIMAFALLDRPGHLRPRSNRSGGDARSSWLVDSNKSKEDSAVNAQTFICGQGYRNRWKAFVIQKQKIPVLQVTVVRSANRRNSF